MGIGDWEEEIKVEKNFKKEMEISKLNKNQQKQIKIYIIFLYTRNIIKI